MEAVILAGGIPSPKHPLHPYTQGKPRALLEIAGKPMVQWVIDALHESGEVERIVLVGLDHSYTINLESDVPITVLTDRGSLLENARAGLLALNDPEEHALVVSSDIPSLRGEMVAWAVETARQNGTEACYFAVPREIMEERFPSSNRTYLRLKDVEVCGADLVVVKPSLASSSSAQWGKLIAARKHPLKQAALLGFDLMLGVLLHRITLHEAARRVSERLGVKGCAALSPYPEMAMDADKPHQVEALRRYLAVRGGANA